MGLLEELYGMPAAGLGLMEGPDTLLSEREMRRLTKKMQAGVELTREEQAALDGHGARQRVVSDLAAEAGLEATGLPGVARAAKDTWNDPSVANATNLGVRSAVAAFKPMAALKVAAAGLGISGARDLGGMVGEAEAQDDGLTPEQRSRLKQLNDRLSKGSWKNAAERRAVEDEARELRNVQAMFAAERNRVGIAGDAEKRSQEQAEYDRTVKGAERSRDAIRATNKSFKDSEVGKVYEKTGGYLPAIAGFGAGMIGRMAHGAPKSLAANAIPVAEGTGATFATMNAPLFYDAFSTPRLNPERDALEAYSRELPPEHPRKAEFQKYAERLPQMNPVQETAYQELTSLPGNARRLVSALGEGGLAGLTGANVPPALWNALGAASALPGHVGQTYNRGMSASRAAKGGLLDDVADAQELRRTAAVTQQRDAYAQQRDAYAQQLDDGGLMAGVATVPRSGVAAAAQGQVQPPLRPQLQPAPSQSPLLPPPVIPPRTDGNGILPNPEGTSNTGLLPAATGANGKTMLELPPELTALANRLLERLEKPATGASGRTKAAVAEGDGAGKPGRAGWQNTWSDPAREAMAARVDAGASVVGGKGGWPASQIQAEIAKRLPDGVEPPSLSKINEMRSKLVAKVGANPTPKELAKAFLADKKRAVWSVPIAAGIGGGLLDGLEGE